MKRRKMGRVTDATVIARLRELKISPELVKICEIHDTWEGLKEARGWRPLWSSRQGFMLNGLPEDRAWRILKTYQGS